MENANNVRTTKEQMRQVESAFRILVIIQTLRMEERYLMLKDSVKNVRIILAQIATPLL